MPRATLFEEDMEIKIFIWNDFTKRLFRECTDRKFGVKREVLQQVPQEEISNDLKTHKKTGRPRKIIGPVIEKFCPHCATLKLAKEFIPCPSRPDGLASYCRDCQSKYFKNRYKKKEKKSIEKTGDAPVKKDLNAPVDNHLSKKMMENSTGGEWDTAEIDILEENFFKLGGKELGALKIIEQGLLPGRTVQEINNMARHKGMMK